jgi:hypothetical protein
MIGVDFANRSPVAQVLSPVIPDFVPNPGQALIRSLYSDYRQWRKLFLDGYFIQERHP